MDSAAPEPIAAAPHGLHEGVLARVLGYQIVLADISTRRVFAEHVGEPMQLKAVEFTILMLLLANQDVTSKRLARTLDVSAPNLTILLDKLQERGLIVRVRSAADRRAQHLHLTAAGLALARRAETTAATMETELTRSLSPAELAMLMELLRKVSGQRG